MADPSATSAVHSVPTLSPHGSTFDCADATISLARRVRNVRLMTPGVPRSGGCRDSHAEGGQVPDLSARSKEHDGSKIGRLEPSRTGSHSRRRQGMADRKVVSREEWLEARNELLAREKEHTRTGDDLARQRRELPWVRIDKDYSFDTELGTKSLAELFDGRSQLMLYTFM